MQTINLQELSEKHPHKMRELLSRYLNNQYWMWGEIFNSPEYNNPPGSHNVDYRFYEVFDKTCEVKGIKYQYTPIDAVFTRESYKIYIAPFLEQIRHSLNPVKTIKKLIKDHKQRLEHLTKRSPQRTSTVIYLRLLEDLTDGKILSFRSYALYFVDWDKGIWSEISDWEFKDRMNAVYEAVHDAHWYSWLKLYLKRFKTEGYSDSSEALQEFPDIVHPTNTKAIAWLHAIGITDQIMALCTDAESMPNFRKAASIIASFTDYPAEGIRKMLTDMYSNPTGKNNPLNSADNRAYVQELLGKFHITQRSQDE